jgi:hypothetical protein
MTLDLSSLNLGAPAPVIDDEARIAELEAELARLRPKKRKNARHSKENPNWQTPADELEFARAALGGKIDLDPFTCAQANERVGATTWFGPDHPDITLRDGFACSWIAETVLENHAGGTTKRAWRKTCDELVAGHCQRVIWIGFSVEQVCILADVGDDSNETDESRWARGAFVPTDFSVCFLRSRIHFIDGDNPTRPSRPGHANFIVGIGIDPATFEAAYRGRGRFTHGALTR